MGYQVHWILNTSNAVFGGKSVKHEIKLTLNFLLSSPAFLPSSMPIFLSSFLSNYRNNISYISKYRKKYSFPIFFFLLLWWDLQTSVELKFTPLPIWQISILAFFSLKKKKNLLILKKVLCNWKFKMWI